MDPLAHICFAGQESRHRGRDLMKAAAHPANPLATEHPGPAHGARTESEAVDPFIRWIFAQSGLDVGDYRPRALQRRLSACLRRLRCPSSSTALEKVRQQPELVATALDTLLIGVTDFFRDPEVFRALHQDQLPSLLALRPSGLRVLSAGASDGRELYSVALLLADLGALEGSRLLGIDCRADALVQAGKGRFHERDLATVPLPWRQRHFLPDGDRFVVDPTVRRQLEWRLGSLSSIQDGTWDVILFRNVVIYFDEVQAAAAWNNLTSRLAPQGILVSGKAEKPPAGCPLVRLGPAIYRRRDRDPSA